jgi:hypothetical protein
MPKVKESKGKAVSGHVMKRCRESEEIDTLTINPRTRWKLVINFIPPASLPPEKNTFTH